MWLSPGKTVKVAVSSLNGSKLVNTLDSSKTIAYTLTGAEQMAFLPGDYMKSYDLSVNIAEAEWQKAASGEHTDAKLPLRQNILTRNKYKEINYEKAYFYHLHSAGYARVASFRFPLCS